MPISANSLANLRALAAEESASERFWRTAQEAAGQRLARLAGQVLVEPQFPQTTSGDWKPSANGEAVKKSVQEAYAITAARGALSHFTDGAGVVLSQELVANAGKLGYTAEQLAAAGQGADLGLGCGNPVTLARLRPGEVVVDLGSGAGMDCLIAARAVGPQGKVVGIDFTDEMLGQARKNCVAQGMEGVVDFRRGDIEHLPLPDNCADVIISN